MNKKEGNDYMFENYKSGFIRNKLLKLRIYILLLDDYDITIDKFIPNIIQKNIKNDNKYFPLEFSKKQYEFKINNIEYFLQQSYDAYNDDGNIIAIKSNNITIFYRDEGVIDITEKWVHKLPKEMLKQIKQDSIIINQYNQKIKEYIKTHNTIKQTQWNNDQDKLNKIFR